MSYTTVVAADGKYGPQLQHSVPTWRRFRPELWEHPLVFIADSEWLSGRDARLYAHEVFAHNDISVVEWPTEDYSNVSFGSQRERMLTAHVVVPPRIVESQYWLKLDCDAIATSNATWTRRRWFRPDHAGRRAAAIASRWGYTKTTDGRPWTTVLDDWGDTTELVHYPRLNIPWTPNEKRCRHARWCSWIAFIHCEWGAAAAQLLQRSEQLPVPSQDTFHWYVFERWKARVELHKFKQSGWTNVPRLSTLAAKAREVLRDGRDTE